MVAEQAFSDHNETEENDDEDDDGDDGDYIEAYINIMFDSMCDVLTDIRNILEASVTKTDVGALFIRSLGEALALEWAMGEAPYDEPTADAAQWFLPES